MEVRHDSAHFAEGVALELGQIVSVGTLLQVQRCKLITTAEIMQREFGESADFAVCAIVTRLLLAFDGSMKICALKKHF